MSPTFIDPRNLEFLLYEHFDVAKLTSAPYFEDHDRETFELVLETAHKMASDLLWPCFREMDREPPVLEDGRVRIHPAVRAFLKECGQGGWLGAHAPCDLGGQQMPNTIMAAFRGILAAANYSASVFPMLTSGASHLITSFASPELVETYVAPMFDGSWQGTMALTEPQAGSSLADVRTTATPTEHDYYLIRGQKIFISAAEHDAVSNVVNLLLARIDGAPAGTKGISLFIVPNRRPLAGGALEPNDVTCATIYHKLGYRGSPITQLSLGDDGDCRGWLVGEPHKGLKYMFQMMNEARIEVGMGAAAIASAAYHAARDYALERPQGRAVTNRDASTPQIAIIEHPDVKRMLLFQRAVVEGSLALVLQSALYSDQLRALDGEEREKASLLLDLLTPVAKSYPSEMGILAVSQGLQCLGGYGYCDEFPLEQYYRDIRIHPIHEGTTGIQALDLLGRKIVMKGGKAAILYLGEVAAAISEAKAIPSLVPQAHALERAVGRLQEVTQHLTGLAMKGQIDLFLADATLYLELFGIVAVAWQWLRQAITAARALEHGASEADERFYQSKLYTFRFFFGYELPKIEGLAVRLLDSDGLTLEIGAEHFA